MISNVAMPINKPTFFSKFKIYIILLIKLYIFYFKKKTF